MHQNCWQWSTSVSFFLIFPDFLSIFTLIAILGNVHRWCTLYLNIINKYTSCLPSLCWLFADFFNIFALITILGSVHRPCKQYPKINTTIHISFWFYHYFSSENVKLSIFGIFKLHSGHWIPVPFQRPDSINSTFTCQW